MNENPKDDKRAGIPDFKEVRTKIKELERLNLELARRHNKLEAIFNGISDGLAILNRELTVVYANQVQRDFFSDSRLVGRKCYELFFRREKACRKCPALQTLETGKTIRGETLYKKGDLAGRSFEWTISPIKDPLGRVEEIIILMKDVTGKRDSEFRVMQSEKMAEVGFLAAGVAHEINNPLTSIAGFSEALLKRIDSFGLRLEPKIGSYLKEYLQIINSEAYRCKDIIKNLLDFSRPSAEEYEILSIDRIIAETLALIRQHGKDSQIQTPYRNGLSAGMEAIAGNESQLKHVFLSLFNRSFKKMPDGGTLHTLTRNNGGNIEILISDRPLSSGIPSGWSETDENALNMSICYKIIRQHQGEILHSRGEDGSFAFSVTFPLVFT